MPELSNNLVLERCPHCAVSNQNLPRQHSLETRDHTAKQKRIWSIYVCSRCGGVVSAWAGDHGGPVVASFPVSKSVKDDIPDKPRAYLQQATESLHAPAGAVMLAASAVDAMLKLKGYTEGTLYQRIQRAVEQHVLTPDMATWAHDVRLDANDQRHADEAAVLPHTGDAERAVDFALALAELLFVLPNRVQIGIKQAAG